MRTPYTTPAEIRDWSLITGKGGGGYKAQGGVCEVLPLRKRGEGGVSAMLEGGGAQTVLG